MKSPRLITIILLATLGGIPLEAVNVQFEQVARTGDAVPGREALNVVFNGRAFQPSQNVGVLSRPSINDNGDVVIRGVSTDPNNFNVNAAIGLYAKPSGGPLLVLVDSTEVSAGVPTFAVPGRPATTRFTNFSAPVINNQGDVVFRGNFTGGVGIYAMTIAGGPIVKIVDTFDDAPGFAGTRFNGFFFGGFNPPELFLLNNNGQVAFLGSFFRIGASFQDLGLYGSTVSGSGIVRLADSTGSIIPQGEVGSFYFVSSSVLPALNDNGTVLFHGGIGTTPVSLLQGIWTVPVDGSALPVTVGRRGQQSPPLSDAVTRAYFSLWGGYDLNDSGTLLFQHAFASSSTAVNALIAGQVGVGATLDIVDNIGTNFAVPGRPGSSFTSISAAALNDAGQFGFHARDDTPSANGQGLYAADVGGSAIRLIANNAMVPPGRTSPAVFNNFDSRSAAINDPGNMALAPSASNEAQDDAVFGLYFFDTCTGALERVVDRDTSAPVPPNGLDGTFAAPGCAGSPCDRAVTLFDGLEVRNGAYRSINNTNDIAFLVAFSTFDVGVYIAHLETTGGGSQFDIECPPDAVVECGDDTTPGGTAGAAAAANVCTGEAIAAGFADVATDDCGATGVITRTWTADDGQGNSVSCDHTITISDATAPSLAGVPGDVSVECDAVPSAANATATDACGSATVELVETQTPGSCPDTFTLTRTWTATDECGNTSDATQNITVADTVAPVLVGVPADATAECDAVPPPANVTAADNCDAPPPDVTFSETRVDGACPYNYTLLRTWSTTDACGNPASATQTITVVDSAAPLLAGVPADVAVNCDAVPAAATVTATDGCSGSVSVTFDETTVPGGCPNEFTIVRTWSAMDECGNSVSASQTIIVTDTGAPVLAGVPADVTESCDSVSPPSTVTASDDCDAAPTVVLSETQTPGACVGDYTLTRIWTATDACNNVSTASQTVSVVDTEAPTVDCPPDALGLECPADTSVATNGSATGADNCSSVSIVSTDTSVPGCGVTETITRSWTAVDDCGNESSCAQTVSTTDTTAPTITVDTTPIEVDDTDCSGAEAVALPVAIAEDDCDGMVDVSDDAPDPFPAGATTPVTFSAADDCGNGASESLEVTVQYGSYIYVVAKKYTVGLGHHPSVTKTPLSGITIGAYDKSPGSCAREQLDNHWNILFFALPHIIANCTPVDSGTTDDYGHILLTVPPGNYVTATFFDADGDDVPDQYLGDWVFGLGCGETEVSRIFMVEVTHTNPKRHGCKWHRYTGSELIIIEPEEVVWDGTEQKYPFVFDSVGDWDVTVSVAPPEGFVSDYNELTDDVESETSAVQFTITEVGSDLVPTQTAYTIRHKGRTMRMQSSVDIKLTPEYAKERGFNVAALRGRGLIVKESDRPKGKEANRRLRKLR